MKAFKNILFMFRYSLSISRKIFVAAAIEIVLTSAEPFVYLIFPSMLIHELTTERRWNTVLLYISLFAALLLIFRVAKLASTVFTSMSVNGSDVQDSCCYARHFMNMPYENLENEKIRDLQQKVSSNVRANGFVFGTLTGLISSVIKLAGFSYIVFTLNPLVLIFIISITVLNYFLNSRSKKTDYEYQPTLAKHTRFFDYLFSTMTGFDYAKEVRVNSAKKLLDDKFRDALDLFRKDNKRYLNRKTGIGVLLSVVSFIQMIGSYGYVAWSAIIRTISIGEFNLYIGAVYNISDSFNGVVSSFIELKYLSRYVDDYHEYIKAAFPIGEEKELNGCPEEKDGVPLIEFENVSFRYPHTEKTVLDNISIAINRGEKLSIAGLNGAGKTTFIKLICRLYSPTSGVIRYCGVDISTIKREEYLRRIAAVFQDFRIFSFSFLENIILNLSYDEANLDRSLKLAGLVPRIATLPHGVETSIYKDFDEEGVELSGGEGQKLAAARAYYKNAGLVILDEPTASLDAIAENELYQNFNKITDGKTAIFISHRLASTRFCDNIAVFKEGQIIEYGSHDELINSGGLYSELFRKQAEYYKSEDTEK